MEFNVIWSDFAEEKIDEIYEYYKIEASIRVAKNLVLGIIESTVALIENPYLGQIEVLLAERDEKYRYLLYKNYKIIYSVDIDNEYIKIADVFDTRQSPIKMKRNK